MVYNPCPEGYVLRGGVCVPLHSAAIKAFRNKNKKFGGDDSGGDTPEPPVPPDPPVPPPDPPVPPPDPPTPPKPDPEPERFKKVNTKGMSDADIAALLTAAGMVATGGAIRGAALGGVNIFQSSSGTTIAATNSGEGLGAIEGVDGVGIEMTDFSVLSAENQAATDALLDGAETTPLLDDIGDAGEGIEMTGDEIIGGGTESAAAATADETAGLIGEAGEIAVDVAEGAEVAAEIGEAGIIAEEASAAAVLAPETAGASLIVGGLVIAGTEAALHADELGSSIPELAYESGQVFEDAAKSTGKFFKNIF